MHVSTRTLHDELFGEVQIIKFSVYTNSCLPGISHNIDDVTESPRGNTEVGGGASSDACNVVSPSRVHTTSCQQK